MHTPHTHPSRTQLPAHTCAHTLQHSTATQCTQTLHGAGARPHTHVRAHTQPLCHGSAARVHPSTAHVCTPAQHSRVRAHTHTPQLSTAPHTHTLTHLHGVGAHTRTHTRVQSTAWRCTPTAHGGSPALHPPLLGVHKHTPRAGPPASVPAQRAPHSHMSQPGPRQAHAVPHNIALQLCTGRRSWPCHARSLCCPRAPKQALCHWFGSMHQRRAGECCTPICSTGAAFLVPCQAEPPPVSCSWPSRCWGRLAGAAFARARPTSSPPAPAAATGAGRLRALWAGSSPSGRSWHWPRRERRLPGRGAGGGEEMPCAGGGTGRQQVN